MYVQIHPSCTTKPQWFTRCFVKYVIDKSLNHKEENNLKDLAHQREQIELIPDYHFEYWRRQKKNMKEVESANIELASDWSHSV